MPDSLYLLTLEVRTRDAEALGGLLMELGAGAVEERAAGRRARLSVYGENKSQLARLVSRARASLAGFGVDERSVRIERSSVDWQSTALLHAKPVRLTPRLRIEPGDRPATGDVIAIRPGLAFGDGGHPTTQLAARAVEAYCRKSRGARVLDIGTGNGVLAFVAAKSGAGAVTGIEIDPQVIAIARQNARLNELECDVVFRMRLPRGPGGFDLVVANLEPRVLIAQSAALAAVAARAKHLILTGFLATQESSIRQPFERAGYTVGRRERKQGWLLLSLAPPSGAPRSVSPRSRARDAR